MCQNISDCAKLDRILELLEVLLDRSEAPRTANVGGPLATGILNILQKNPTRWFQAKDFVEEGIRAGNQQIGGACARLVQTGHAEMQLKSQVTGVPVARPEWDYDPKMYRLKEKE